MIRNREKIALIIVDMQKYYLDETSDFSKYSKSFYSSACDYIMKRSFEVVIPNIATLKKVCVEKNIPVLYLKLCGTKQNRGDLHRFFKDAHRSALKSGFLSVYPLESEPMSDIVDELKPTENDIIIHKKTFSPFTQTNINSVLKKLKVKTLIFTGLATSQCVETTARDASERGYSIIHIEDCQADYDENTHHASLYSSRGVCGGEIYDTESFIDVLQEPRVIKDNSK